jgi:hypothetical protein
LLPEIATSARAYFPPTCERTSADQNIILLCSSWILFNCAQFRGALLPLESASSPFQDHFASVTSSAAAQITLGISAGIPRRRSAAFANL